MQAESVYEASVLALSALIRSLQKARIQFARECAQYEGESWRQDVEGKPSEEYTAFGTLVDQLPGDLQERAFPRLMRAKIIRPLR